jgi:hypothetical protein
VTHAKKNVLPKNMAFSCQNQKRRVSIDLAFARLRPKSREKRIGLIVPYLFNASTFKVYPCFPVVMLLLISTNKNYSILLDECILILTGFWGTHRRNVLRNVA